VVAARLDGWCLRSDDSQALVVWGRPSPISPSYGSGPTGSDHLVGRGRAQRWPTCSPTPLWHRWACVPALWTAARGSRRRARRAGATGGGVPGMRTADRLLYEGSSRWTLAARGRLRPGRRAKRVRRERLGRGIARLRWKTRPNFCDLYPNHAEMRSPRRRRLTNALPRKVASGMLLRRRAPSLESDAKGVGT
jgi:hypothetical protein